MVYIKKTSTSDALVRSFLNIQMEPLKLFNLVSFCTVLDALNLPDKQQQLSL